LAATRAGIRLEPVLVNGPAEFEGAFQTMAKAEAQAVIVQPLFEPHAKVLRELAAKHRLAYMSSNREITVAGGLVSLSADYPLLYERTAFYVDKIIRGAKPADLPVEQPTKFHVALNLKTARSLGLTISPTLLAEADEVVE
jgi:putative ABC transport system substrate-binding protein